MSIHLMTDELEDVPLTNQDLGDLMEASAIASHSVVKGGEQADADLVGKGVATLLATANRIAVEHGFVDGSAVVISDAEGFRVRARRG